MENPKCLEKGLFYYLLHVFTATKNYTTLPQRKKLPILPKMHACSQCAHLLATADFVPRFEVLGTPQAAGVM